MKGARVFLIARSLIFLAAPPGINCRESSRDVCQPAEAPATSARQHRGVRNHAATLHRRVRTRRYIRSQDSEIWSATSQCSSTPRTRRLQVPGSALNELECLMATGCLPQSTFFLTYWTKERPKAGLMNHALPHNSANPTPCCSSPSNKPLSAFRSARTPCTAWFARAAFQRSGSAAAGGYPKMRCLNGPEPRCNNPPARRH